MFRDPRGRVIELVPVAIPTGAWTVHVAVLRIVLDASGQPVSLAVGTEGSIEVVPA
jgi:hypothetical protein